jgi:dihydroorotase-like cyclic amidohydrolase
MPLLFSEGVQTGRIDIHRFIDVTATRPAKLFDCFRRKEQLRPAPTRIWRSGIPTRT